MSNRVELAKWCAANHTSLPRAVVECATDVLTAEMAEVEYHNFVATPGDDKFVQTEADIGKHSNCRPGEVTTEELEAKLNELGAAGPNRRANENFSRWIVSPSRQVGLVAADYLGAPCDDPDSLVITNLDQFYVTVDLRKLYRAIGGSWADLVERTEAAVKTRKANQKSFLGGAGIELGKE